MNQTEFLHGTITDDPLLALAPGTKVQCMSVRFPAPSLNDRQAGGTAFDGVLLKIMFGNMDASRVHGCGVMVAPGIALTARHVVASEISSVLAGDSGFLAIAATTHGVDIWRVHQVTVIEKSDIAILVLRRASELPPDQTVKFAEITTRLTPIAESVAIAGYVAKAPEFEVADGLDGQFHVSIGNIGDHYLGGRDQLLPAPCFSVDVGTSGGMSGGPAFDNQGCLVGVLTSGMGQGADGVSFVSMVHHVLTTKITPCWPEGLWSGATTILEVCRAFRSIERPDAIREFFAHSSKPSIHWDTWT